MRRSKKWPIKGAIRTGLLAGCLVGNLSDVQAKNLGQVGPVYSIIETSVVKVQKSTQKRRSNIIEPLSLPTALVETEQYLDLSYTVPRDITDAKGISFTPKGIASTP